MEKLKSVPWYGWVGLAVLLVLVIYMIWRYFLKSDDVVAPPADDRSTTDEQPPDEPVAPAPPGPAFEWEIKSSPLAGGSGLYGRNMTAEGGANPFPDWDACKLKCESDENCNGFWYSGTSHGGCYYQTPAQNGGNVSFMDQGLGGDGNAGIKRYL